MAKVEFSPSGVVGHRGAMGKSVYRMRGEETILSRRPRRSNREPSEAQVAARKRFRAAG